LPGKDDAVAATNGATLEEPAAAGAGSPGHPLAKHLEVAGLRLEGLRSGQVRIRYAVVNHSPADLPELQIRVSLRSDDRTFFEFPAKLPSLGPFEVKDLASTVKTELKPYELPDWQMLRPRLTIESAP
jgi:hypothetical protein